VRVSFVIPWFAENPGGGAETLCLEFARRLAGAGHDVEVLCTCCRDHDANWNENHLPPGRQTAREGYAMHRFPVTPGDHRVFGELNQRLLAGDILTYREELAFFTNSIRSDTLMDFTRTRSADRALVFLPYLFGVTFDGIREFGGRAVLWPCLHDECYAHMKLFADALPRARAIVFNSGTELALAQRLYGTIPEHAVIGMGCDLPAAAEPQANNPQASTAVPYALYLGRKSPEKNLPQLVEFFRRYAASRPGSELHIAGKGDPIPMGHPSIRDLGFLSQDSKARELRSAVTLVMPSLRESFSIVVAEALAHGTPVLAHAGCAVARDLVSAGNCGLYYAGYDEFAACLDILFTNRPTRDALGCNGREFVRQRLRWADKVDALARFLSRVVPHAN
jgi:glycosyltransferase involved in cell wall biosynthesis